MKKILFFLSMLVRTSAYAQDYWQQEVHYHITVTLNDSSNTLKAFEQIEYINHSPDTLHVIWFHLWPNAYKNQNTALYKQLSAFGETSSLHNFEKGGYIDSLQFTVDGKSVHPEKDPENIDICTLVLPQPLLPGASVIIATPFTVKIPPYFSRLGYEGQNYMITQWYPKPAVYDRRGWHPMPYLDLGEFYSEFGSFDVHITVPAEYVVAATGSLETPAESVLYKTTGRKNLAGETIKFQPDRPDHPKTLSFHADHVHDFAWFASKHFIIYYDTLALASGRVIDVFAYHQLHGDRQWAHSIAYIKDAVRHYSAWIGEYAYPVVSAVEGPSNSFSGGMEYPMITLISNTGVPNFQFGQMELDDMITHEVGHNWFYGMLGNNERDHAWMDEGIDTYYEFRYEAEKYKSNTQFGALPNRRQFSADDLLSAIYNRINTAGINYAIETPAAAFGSEQDYANTEYHKAALWMYILEKTIGRDNLDKGMHVYFNEWKFKHPYPGDMQTSLENATKTGLKDMFLLLQHKGSFD